MKPPTKERQKTVAAWVDRKLASPHLANGGLSIGSMSSAGRKPMDRKPIFRKGAWLYRDYVIEAFNQDKPYDQFVTEQIAGDDGSGAAKDSRGWSSCSRSHSGTRAQCRAPGRADRMDEIMQTIGLPCWGSP